MNLEGRILQALRKAGQEPISSAALSEQLATSPAAIWPHIKELQEQGYEIEATPHFGYRLLASPDVLQPNDLVSRLPAKRLIGRDIQVFQETTSTNDIIDKLARDGVPEGVVVFAEAQTRGRGRLGRSWVSPPSKGLWFSVLLTPRLPPREATQITILSATAVRRAIERVTELEAKIKWPNDILVRNRKVAGILTEIRAEPDQVQYVVLGIGVDVNLSAVDFPPELRASATSLKIEGGRAFSRAELAVALLEELELDYRKLSEGRFPELADEWEKGCQTIGQSIVIRVGKRQLKGRAEALDEDGALLLRSSHGHLERIVGGDVSLDET